MTMAKCPACGIMLTKEMIDANLCWECGKILDDRLFEEDLLEETLLQQIPSEEMLLQSEEKEVAKHKLTTGYNFEGYNITNYLGLVSGEIVMGTGFLADLKASLSDLFGTKSKAYSDKLKDAKKAALNNMIIESINNEGDAIIGISYEYITFSGNMIGISVNGTSVKIEKVL